MRGAARNAVAIAALALGLVNVAAPGTAWAQTAASPQAPASADSTSDTSSVIRGVIIRRLGIFEPGEDDSWLTHVANALHVTTRRRVVERELLFHAGERFDAARVAETERNLRALGIFRRVLVDSVRTDSGLVLRVTTKDGWSARPQLDFSSAGSQTEYTIGLAEQNLFGNAAYGALAYSDQPDRTTITALFRQPRLIANRIYLQLGYQHRSDGRSLSFGLGQPFLSYAARTGVQLGAVDFDGDVLRFVNGGRTASTVLRRRYALLRFDGARALSASTGGFVRVGFVAQLRRDDFVSRDALGPAPFPRTITAAAGPYLWLNRAHFLVVHNYRSFLREEDVDLSPALIVGAYAAPRAFGYARNGVGVQAGAQAGLPMPGGFAQVGASATGLYTGAGLDSGTVRVTGTWMVQPARPHTLVLQAQLGWQKNPLPGEEFDLGLTSGPRGFYAHAFTGDRFVNLTAEYRWTAAEDLWGALGVGLAAFVDHGGAWYDGSPRRTGTDTGFGLRLGPSRTTDGEAVRIDFVRRFSTDVEPAGWALVVGSGVRY